MTRTLIPTLLMFILGAAVAATALTAFSRIAHGAPSEPAAGPPEPPAGSVSPDPWRTGAPMAAILVGVAGLGFAGSRRDPRRAWLWAAIAGAALLAVDTLRTGTPPSLEMLLGAGSVLTAGVMPGTLRPRHRAAEVADPLATEAISEPGPRRPEAGAAHAPVLLVIAAVPLLVFGAGLLWSCAGVKRAANTVTDCAVAVAPAELQKAIASADGALELARRPDGTIDTAPLVDLARSMSLAVGGCAIAEVLARHPATLAPTAGPTAAEKAWHEVQARQYPGHSFRLASGEVR